MEYSNIKVARENSVATIRLNRPDVMNALSPELLQEDAVHQYAKYLKSGE